VSVTHLELVGSVLPTVFLRMDGAEWDWMWMLSWTATRGTGNARDKREKPLDRVDTHPRRVVCSRLKILERPAERIAHTLENHLIKSLIRPLL
jgi:hypothetical protein